MAGAGGLTAGGSIVAEVGDVGERARADHLKLQRDIGGTSARPVVIKPADAGERDLL